MIYVIKQKGLYQNKVNSSLFSSCNCKMNNFFFFGGGGEVGGIVTWDQASLLFFFLASLLFLLEREKITPDTFI